jgi:RNA recognition motif-containing protein
LKEIFEQFGETEKGGIKVQKTGTSNVFAFVCFKTPDAAAAAKQTLHNQNFEGKTMMINHYEIKELRNLQKEEAMDKSGFEQYMASKTGGFHLNDLITHPHMTQILQQLLEIMQTNEAMNTHFHHQERQMRGGHGGRGGYNNRGGNYQNRGGHHGGNQGYNNHQQNQGQNMGGHQGGMPNPQGM